MAQVPLLSYNLSDRERPFRDALNTQRSSYPPIKSKEGYEWYPTKYIARACTGILPSCGQCWATFAKRVKNKKNPAVNCADLCGCDNEACSFLSYLILSYLILS